MTWASVAMKVLELLERSVIIQGSVTLLVTSVVGYLAITQCPIPTIVSDMALLILGYWFGSKAQQEITYRVNQERKAISNER